MSQFTQMIGLAVQNFVSPVVGLCGRPSVKDPKTGARKPVRGSTWTYQFAVPKGDGRRFVTKGGFPTRKAAEAALAEALSDHGRGWVRGVDRPTVIGVAVCLPVVDEHRRARNVDIRNPGVGRPQ